MDTCINCGRSSEETPVLRFTFKGDELGICSACLPILIHRPDRLADRLAGAEEITPGPGHHD